MIIMLTLLLGTFPLSNIAEYQRLENRMQLPGAQKKGTPRGARQTRLAARGDRDTILPVK